MRLRTPSRGLALSAALLLTLTACNGGSPEEEGSVSPTTTAPASASDGGSSEGSGSESEGSETAEPSGSESGDAESTEGGGEYVPASADGPAQNVPKPQMPEAMKEETEEGAKAAVAYWWDTLYYLQQTGDAEPMLEVSSEDCNYCQRYAKGLENVYAEGHWHSGSKPSVTSSLVGGNNPQKRALALTLLISFGDGVHFNPDGTRNEELTTAAAKDEPWYNDVRFNPDRGRWDVTYAALGGPDNG